MCGVNRHTGWFMHDGARLHTARIVSNWLDDNNFNHFKPWPGNSPDLNPIENLWATMKQRLRGRDTSTVKKLTKEIEDIWEKLDKNGKDIIENLAVSLPDRLQEVKKRKGRSTKY